MNELNLPHSLLRLRQEKKLTQEEVAQFIGVTKAAVSKWERGQSLPDIVLLPRLAAFFGVTVDALLGYEAQLSGEQIRRQYAELCREFAEQSFAKAAENVRSLADRYYSCYPLLLQLGILCWNHYMLAQTPEEGQQLLQEAVGWCGRILENSKEVSLCSDAVVLKAGLNLLLGRPEETIKALEPASDPSRMAEQSGVLLIQAYQVAGETEKARRYVQVRQYLTLLAMIGEAGAFLSLYAEEIERCRTIIQRGRGLIELYQVESLHPNQAAMFYYQAAAVYARKGCEEEALEILGRFAACIEQLLGEDPLRLHGDEYFDQLDAWIEQLPLGSMAPRDPGFIRQNLREAFSKPDFDSIRGNREFQRLVQRIIENQ